MTCISHKRGFLKEMAIAYAYEGWHLHFFPTGGAALQVGLIILLGLYLQGEAPHVETSLQPRPPWFYDRPPLLQGKIVGNRSSKLDQFADIDFPTPPPRHLVTASEVAHSAGDCVARRRFRDSRLHEDHVRCHSWLLVRVGDSQCDFKAKLAPIGRLQHDLDEAENTRGGVRDCSR